MEEARLAAVEAEDLLDTAVVDLRDTEASEAEATDEDLVSEAYSSSKASRSTRTS